MTTQQLSKAKPEDIANAWYCNRAGNWVQVQPAVVIASQMFNTTHDNVTQAMATDAVAQVRAGTVRYNVVSQTQHNTAWRGADVRQAAKAARYAGAYGMNAQQLAAWLQRNSGRR